MHTRTCKSDHPARSGEAANFRHFTNFVRSARKPPNFNSEPRQNRQKSSTLARHFGAGFEAFPGLRGPDTCTTTPLKSTSLYHFPVPGSAIRVGNKELRASRVGARPGGVLGASACTPAPHNRVILGRVHLGGNPLTRSYRVVKAPKARLGVKDHSHRLPMYLVPPQCRS